MASREIPIPYPIKGIHKGVPYEFQPEGTSPDELNVRSWDPILERARGGQRFGTSKRWQNAINGTNFIQRLDSLVTQNLTTPLAPGTTGLYDSGGAYLQFVRYFDGHLYVGGAVSASKNLWKIKPDGTLVSSTLVTGNTNNETREIDFDEDGNLYVTHDAQGNKKGISKLNPSFAEQWTFSATDTTQGGWAVLVDEPNSRVFCGVGPGGALPTSVHSISQSAGTLNWSYNTADVVTGIAFDSVNTKLYAAGDRANDGGGLASLWVLNPNNGDFIARKDSGSDLREVVVLDDGSVIICGNTSTTLTGDTKSVWKLSSDLATVQASYNTTAFALSIRRTGRGTVLVGNARGTDANTIYELSETDLSLIDKTDTGANSQNATQGPDGVIYSANVDVGGFTLWRWVQSQLPTVTYRQTEMTVVSGGSVYHGTDGVKPTLATGGTSALSATSPDIGSVGAFGKFYYVDGSVYKTLDPATATVSTWTPTAGSLPLSGSNAAALITLWHGRVLLAGVQGDDQNIFGSKIFDALDWDDKPAVITELSPWNLNASAAGRIGDVVTSLMPFNEEVLFVGGDHSLHVLFGDIRSGGRIDTITRTIGVAWGYAWTQGPDGTIYFFGTDGIVYSLVPGQLPQPMTETRIDKDLKAVDMAKNRVRLAWNRREHALRVFVTPIKTGTATHYQWDKRLDAWHPDQYPDAHGPTAVLEFDADDPNDRRLFLGGRDSIIRQVDPTKKDDDGTAIASHVVYPPVALGRNTVEYGIDNLIAKTALNTDSITYEIRVGKDAETAVAATASYTGAWTTGGRQAGDRSRARGNVLYAKLSNTAANSAWGMESLSAQVQPLSHVRV